MSNVTRLTISSITIGERCRREYGDLEGLADSIKTEGLYHPIVVTSSGLLVTGERRLRAYRDVLGETEIPARIVEDSTPAAAEYHENEDRKDFTSAERAAVVEKLRRDKTRDPDSGRFLASDKTAAAAAAEAGTSRRNYFYNRKPKSSIRKYTRRGPSYKELTRATSRFRDQIAKVNETTTGSRSDRDELRAQALRAKEELDALIANLDAAPDPKPRKRRRKAEQPSEEPRERPPTISEKELDRGWERLTNAQRERCEAKAAAVSEALTVTKRDGIALKEAMKSVAAGVEWSASTMIGWFYGRNGQAGLCDYPRNQWALVLAPKHFGGSKEAECHPAAWAAFKTDYLRPEEPPLEMCFRNLQRLAKTEGWEIPRSAAALKRRLAREMPRTAINRARGGPEALERMRPAQIRSREGMRALSAVNGDARKSDVFVKWPDGEITRPWLMGWQDIAFSKILSWRVDKSENTTGYQLAFGDLLDKYGVPQDVYLDNGRAFAAKVLTGGAKTRYRYKIRPEDPEGLLTRLLGKDHVHWALPYHGQSKPIERAFRDMASDIDKDHRLRGAYTGNKPNAKPENYRSKAIPLAKFLQVLDEGIRRHNARGGRRGQGLEGRSFDEAFRESYEFHFHAGDIPQPTRAQLDLCLLTAQGIKAHKDTGAVVVHGTRYWTEALAEKLAGRTAAQRAVVVRFDPEHLDRPVLVETLDGKLIARADPWGPVKFMDAQAAKDHARDKARLRKATGKVRKIQSGMDARALDDLLDSAGAEEREAEAPPVQSKLVAGVFGKVSAKPVAVDAVREEVDEMRRRGDTNVIEMAKRDLGDGSGMTAGCIAEELALPEAEPPEDFKVDYL